MLKTKLVKTVTGVKNYNELKIESLFDYVKSKMNYKEFMMYMPVKDDLNKIPRSYILDVIFNNKLIKL